MRCRICHCTTLFVSHHREDVPYPLLKNEDKIADDVAETIQACIVNTSADLLDVRMTPVGNGTLLVFLWDSEP